MFGFLNDRLSTEVATTGLVNAYEFFKLLLLGRNNFFQGIAN